MTGPEHIGEDGGDQQIARLVRRAYRTPVDVETASRHLWRVHQVARAQPARGGASRTLVSALAAVLLFVTTGTAVAVSGQALPGDSLYPVKRGAERLHLLVSFAPDSDARLHLRFARSRVTEAERVASSRPEAVPALASEIVASVDLARTVGGREMADEVDLVRSEASTALSSLDGALEEDLAASLDGAIRELGGSATAQGDAREQEAEPGTASAGSATEPGVSTATPAGDPDAGAAADSAGAGDPRPEAPDRAAPPPALARDRDTDGGTAPGGADSSEPDAEPPDSGAAAPASPGPDEDPPGDAPGPAPEGTAEPDAEEIAAGGTMPRLARLEGLLREP